MNLALFDLDNTLLSGDSDYEWAQFLIGQRVVDKEIMEAKNKAFHDQYKAGTLDIYEFLEFQLGPLARHDRDELDAWHREFMTNRITPIMSKKSVALVNRHLDAGDLCAVVTATNCFVTGPIAHAYGIPHLIATIAEVDTTTGRFTGRPSGTPAFREGKITRIDAWLESLGLWKGHFDKRYFYSDSLNDLPLLSTVTHPVAVDPDPTLKAHAEKNNWPVISLRS